MTPEDAARSAVNSNEVGAPAPQQTVGESQRSSFGEASDSEVTRDLSSLPEMVREFVRQHPVALGAGAAFVGGTIYTVVKVRRSLPFRIYRAVRRRSWRELRSKKR